MNLKLKQHKTYSQKTYKFQKASKQHKYFLKQTSLNIYKIHTLYYILYPS